MNNCCFYCNNTIETKKYFAFDRCFCSIICRDSIYKINKKIDPNFNNSNLWITNINDLKVFEKKIIENKKKEIYNSILNDLIVEINNEISFDISKEILKTREEIIEKSKSEIIEKSKTEIIEKSKSEIIEKSKREIIEKSKDENDDSLKFNKLISRTCNLLKYINILIVKQFLLNYF